MNNRRIAKIPGVKTSLKSAQSITPYGLAALDVLLGGGIPVGSLVLFEEDSCGDHIDSFVKCYLAEGVTHNNAIFLATDGRVTVDTIIHTIPPPIDDSKRQNKNDKESLPGNKEIMDIAWRYEEMAPVSASITSGRSHANHPSTSLNYDLHKTIAKETLDAATIVSFDASDHDNAYSVLVSSVAKELSKPQYSGNLAPGTAESTNLMRIYIRGFGSPFWGAHDASRMLTTLYSLKSLIRTHQAILLLTVPGDQIDSGLLQRLVKISDFSFHLESFMGSDKKLNPLYADYDGLLKIGALSMQNRILPHLPDSWEYGYAVKKKKIAIERLHLPPDLSETASRTSQAPGGTAVGMSCSSNFAGSKLDF